MPMRSPTLWSETLLNAISKKDTSPPPPPEEHDVPLQPRHMEESYSEIVLPFGSSSQLLEQYVNAWGGIRIGKLMEHLDSLAGSIAYKHMLGPATHTLGRIDERGFYIVTASVDRLDMLAPLSSTRDLRLSGQVIYTGRSSMEVAVKMEAFGDNKPEETVLLGRFSMVCRDAHTHCARKVNPLVCTTPEEKALHDLGKLVKQRRTALAQISLSRLHAVHLKHGQGITEPMKLDSGKDHVWMGDTILEENKVMFPQERNVHQKVFGGYLMRLAHELGYTSASMFTRGNVKFLSLDGTAFKRPVPIGSILRLRSQILYTTTTPDYPILVHVGVRASVVDVHTGAEEVTNHFRFTWAQRWGSESPGLRQVVPRTYREAMMWLEGKRALELGAEIRGMRTDKALAGQGNGEVRS
ncbi:HotDog domain-containing protein [Panaeolus papilionaceus]|nr:HotDog domain-containing protein [Panaeolus papilionaceus]